MAQRTRPVPGTAAGRPAPRTAGAGPAPAPHPLRRATAAPVRTLRAGPCSRCGRSSASPSASPGCRSWPTRTSSTPTARQHSGPADRVQQDQPAPSPPRAPHPLRRADRHRDRAGGAGGRTGRAARAVDPGGGGGRHRAVAHPVPDGELPLLPVLHRRRHRLPVRLDPAAPGGLGRRALARCGDRTPGGGREQARATDRRPDPFRSGPAGLRPLRQGHLHGARGTAVRRRTAARSSSTSGAASCSAGPTPSTAARWSSAAPRWPRRPWSGAVAAGAAAGLGRAVGGAKSPAGRGTSALSPTAAGRRHHDDRRRPGRPRRPPAPGPGGTQIGLASQVPGRRRGDLHGPGHAATPGSCSSSPRATSSPTTRSARTQAARSGYSQGAKLIVCPCHGSEFDPTTGAVVSPPAPRGLTPIHVAVNANGELLADG